MKTSLMGVSAAALCLLAAGCGSAPALSAPPGGRVASQRGAGPTLAGNRRLARAEAARLLALVPVPAGARLLRTAPVQPMGYPGVAGLADARRVWRLAMPFDQASTWIAAYRPAGLRQTVSGSAGPPAVSGYTYAGPD